MTELSKLLQPVIEERDAALSQRDALREQLRVLDTEVATLDKVLRAAGLSENGHKKKEKKAPPSEDAQRRVLDYVNSHSEVDTKTTAEALGISRKYANTLLGYLRDTEQIRLLRVDAATPNGKGHKPVYAPWPTA